MGIFDKIFGKKQKDKAPETVAENKVVNKPPDEVFVEEFIAKGGRFLYCTKKEEVVDYLSKILRENAWETVHCFDADLISFLSVLNIDKNQDAPVFLTHCEHLIAEDGSILFSSNQLKETKLTQYPQNFIVYATTSQLIHNKDKALTSIKQRFKKEIPSNISAVKDYKPDRKETGFMHYGNMNSKNLYLLLYEDL